MRFSYVFLCGVYTYFCAVLRYSCPPYAPHLRRRRVLSPPVFVEGSGCLCTGYQTYIDFWSDKITRESPYTTGNTSLAAKQVCLGLVKRATCIDFVGKSRTFPQQPDLQWEVWFVVVIKSKCAITLFNSFGIMVCKTSSAFFVACLPSLGSALLFIHVLISVTSSPWTFIVVVKDNHKSRLQAGRNAGLIVRFTLMLPCL